MTKGVQDRMVEVERIRDAFHSAIFSAAGLEAWDQTALLAQLRIDPADMAAH